jgi:hypothetical protein
MLLLMAIGGPLWLIMMFVAYLLRQKQFPLRDLFWLMAVAGCLLGWWHDHGELYAKADWHRRSANIANQRANKMAEEARKAGYKVPFDDSTTDIFCRRIVADLSRQAGRSMMALRLWR